VPIKPWIACGIPEPRTGTKFPLSDCSTIGDRIVSPGSKGAIIIAHRDVSVDLGQPDEWRSFPAEHFFRRGGALMDAPYQEGVFRRDTSVLLALASRMPPDSVYHHTGGQSAGSLAFSPSPRLIRTEAVPVPNDAVFTHMTTIAPGPQLVSLEVPLTRYPFRTARARFAVTAPNPLGSLPANEIAVSPPVLISPDTGRSQSAVATSSLEHVLPRMLPSRKVATARFAIYWETYGVQAKDSIEFTITLTPTTPRAPSRSFLDRLRGRQPNPPGAANEPLFTVRWTEGPGDHQGSSAGAGRGTVAGREVTLRASSIPPGDYRLTVLARRQQQTVLGSSVLQVQLPAR
jgi:hypothetical protein